VLVDLALFTQSTSPLIWCGSSLIAHQVQKEQELGFNVLQRKWMNLSLKDELDVIPFRPTPDSVIGYDKKNSLHCNIFRQIVVELDFLKKASPPKVFDQSLV
jgi:hypothetical protein